MTACDIRDLRWLGLHLIQNSSILAHRIVGFNVQLFFGAKKERGGGVVSHPHFIAFMSRNEKRFRRSFSTLPPLLPSKC